MKNELNEITTTILEQCGGRTMCAMIGVSSIIASPDSIKVRFKARGKDGINVFHVKLDPSDTYVVSFYRENKNGSTLKGQYDDIYCDMLQSLIEEKTGLVLTAPRILRAPATAIPIRKVEAPKRPKWLGEWLDNGNQALVGIIGKQLNWDITQARALVVEILQDVNDHGAAEKVNDLLNKIFDGEEG